MANIEIQAQIQTKSQVHGGAGLQMGLCTKISSPVSLGFGPPPTRPFPKNTLRIVSMDVTSQQGG